MLLKFYEMRVKIYRFQSSAEANMRLQQFELVNLSGYLLKLVFLVQNWLLLLPWLSNKTLSRKQKFHTRITSTLEETHFICITDSKGLIVVSAKLQNAFWQQSKGLWILFHLHCNHIKDRFTASMNRENDCRDVFISTCGSQYCFKTDFKNVNISFKACYTDSLL